MKKYSIKEIAKQYCTSETTVYKHLRKITPVEIIRGTHYYSQSQVDLIELNIRKVIVVTKEINWLLLPSKMNYL